MTVSNLIFNYKCRVNAIDMELEAILENIRKKRKEQSDYAYLLQERMNKEDIRQVYFQIIKDLEDVD